MVPATPVTLVVVVAVPVGTKPRHLVSLPVLTPLWLVAGVLVVIPPNRTARAPPSVTLQQLEVAAVAVAPAELTPASPVVLVEVAPAPVPVVVLQPGRDNPVVLPWGRRVVALVVALAISVGLQAARTMLVTVARVYHFTPCIGRVVAEEEAALSLALESEAAPMRVLAVMPAAVPAVPVVSPLTEVVTAAPQCVPRMPASPAPLILVAEVVAGPLAAYRRDSQIRAPVGPALLLLGISHPQWKRLVVPKPPTAAIPYTPSTPLVHL